MIADERLLSYNSCRNTNICFWVKPYNLLILPSITESITFDKLVDMEQKLEKVSQTLSKIKDVSDISIYPDQIWFCYDGLYFLVTNIEGYGNLDNYAHIVLANTLKIEEEHIEIGKDLCIQTMIEYDNVRLILENDCNIIIHTQVDYNDRRLSKVIKSCLKDMIAAKDYFIDKYIMNTAFADNKS